MDEVRGDDADGPGGLFEEVLAGRIDGEGGALAIGHRLSAKGAALGRGAFGVGLVKLEGEVAGDIALDFLGEGKGGLLLVFEGDGLLLQRAEGDFAGERAFRGSGVLVRAAHGAGQEVALRHARLGDGIGAVGDGGEDDLAVLARGQFGFRIRPGDLAVRVDRGVLAAAVLHGEGRAREGGVRRVGLLDGELGLVLLVDDGLPRRRRGGEAEVDGAVVGTVAGVLDGVAFGRSLVSDFDDVVADGTVVIADGQRIGGADAAVFGGHGSFLFAAFVVRHAGPDLELDAVLARRSVQGLLVLPEDELALEDVGEGGAGGGGVRAVFAAEVEGDFLGVVVEGGVAAFVLDDLIVVEFAAFIPDGEVNGGGARALRDGDRDRVAADGEIRAGGRAVDVEGEGLADARLRRRLDGRVFVRAVGDLLGDGQGALVFVVPNGGVAGEGERFAFLDLDGHVGHRQIVIRRIGLPEGIGAGIQLDLAVAAVIQGQLGLAAIGDEDELRAGELVAGLVHFLHFEDTGALDGVGEGLLGGIVALDRHLLEPALDGGHVRAVGLGCLQDVVVAGGEGDGRIARRVAHGQGIDRSRTVLGLAIFRVPVSRRVDLEGGAAGEEGGIEDIIRDVLGVAIRAHEPELFKHGDVAAGGLIAFRARDGGGERLRGTADRLVGHRRLVCKGDEFLFLLAKGQHESGLVVDGRYGVFGIIGSFGVDAADREVGLGVFSGGEGRFVLAARSQRIAVHGEVGADGLVGIAVLALDRGQGVGEGEALKVERTLDVVDARVVAAEVRIFVLADLDRPGDRHRLAIGVEHRLAIQRLCDLPYRGSGAGHRGRRSGGVGKLVLELDVRPVHRGRGADVGLERGKRRAIRHVAVVLDARAEGDRAGAGVAADLSIRDGDGVCISAYMRGLCIQYLNAIRHGDGDLDVRETRVGGLRLAAGVFVGRRSIELVADLVVELIARLDLVRALQARPEQLDVSTRGRVVFGRFLRDLQR